MRPVQPGDLALGLRGMLRSQLCELRRKEPQDDLTTEMVRAEEAGDRLTGEELRANIGLLFGAGHETTTNLIGNGLLALHRNPEQWQRIKREPALIPGMIEELLRGERTVFNREFRMRHEDGHWVWLRARAAL